VLGKINNSSAKASNLKLVAVPNPTNGAAPGTIALGSSSAIHADIYAPQSPITLSGGGAIYGAILGKSIDMTGTADIYYDLSMAGGDGVVKVVQ
jgi:hypothetical protein